MGTYFLDTSAIVKRYGPIPIFVCADIGLSSVATTEGLSVENPNNYP
jgi:hypothetical protein